MPVRMARLGGGTDPDLKYFVIGIGFSAQAYYSALIDGGHAFSHDMGLF